MIITEKEKAHLATLVAASVFENVKIKDSMGMERNVQDLMHAMTINQLKKIYYRIDKEHNDIKAEPWEDDEESKSQKEELQLQRDMIGLIIKYRKSSVEETYAKSAAAEIQRQIDQLEEESLTPQEKIAKLKAKQSELLSKYEETTAEPVKEEESK